MKFALLPAVALVAVSGVAAHPSHPQHQALHHKRNGNHHVVVTKEVIETELVFETVFLKPGEKAGPSQPPINVEPSINYITNTVFDDTQPSVAAVVNAPEVIEQPEPVEASTTAPPPPPPPATTTAPPGAVFKEEPKQDPPPPPAQSKPPKAPGNVVGEALNYGLSIPSGGPDRATQCGPGSPCSGDLTFYDVTGDVACGYRSVVGQGASMKIVALAMDMMGESSNIGGVAANGNCGRQIRVSHPQYGSTDAIVVDKCGACSHESIDLSRAAFQAMGVPESVGRLQGCTWEFIN